jgi:hypothetical protein
MKETALTAMNYAEFQHLMDAYITLVSANLNKPKYREMLPVDLHLTKSTIFRAQSAK